MAVPLKGFDSRFDAMGSWQKVADSGAREAMREQRFEGVM